MVLFSCLTVKIISRFAKEAYWINSKNGAITNWINTINLNEG